MKKLLGCLSLLFLLASTSPALAQQDSGTPNPLARLLQSKGIITEQEAATLNEATTPAEAERRLAKLLLTKGVLSQQEYEQTIAALAARTPSAQPTPQAVPAIFTPNETASKD